MSAMSAMSAAQAPQARRQQLSSHPSAALPAPKPRLQLFSAFSQEQAYPKPDTTPTVGASHP